MICEFCSEELDKSKPTFRVKVDEDTLVPCGRSGGVFYYFCSKDCKARWLASPRDECFVCHRAVKTDVVSAILRYVERGGLDFYVCSLPTTIHDEWSERIDSFLEELEADRERRTQSV